VAINQKDINKLFSTLRTRIHELNNGHVATAIPKSEYRIIVYRLYFAAVQHPEIFLPLLKKEREAMNKAKHLLDSRLSLEEKAILEKEDWYWEMYVLLGEEIDEILYDLDNIIENLTLTIAVRPAAPVSTIPEMPALRWLGTERQLKSLYVLLTNNPDETKAAVIQTDEEVFKQAFSGGTLNMPLNIRWIKKPPRNKLTPDYSSIFNLIKALQNIRLIEKVFDFDDNKTRKQATNLYTLTGALFCREDGSSFLASHGDKHVHLRNYLNTARNNPYKTNEFGDMLQEL